MGGRGSSGTSSSKTAGGPAEGGGASRSEQASPEDSLRAAYRELATDPGEFANLADIRSRMTGTRAEQDAALSQMFRSQQINLIPKSLARSVTDADRSAALRIGGEDKHLVTVNR